MTHGTSEDIFNVCFFDSPDFWYIYKCKSEFACYGLRKLKSGNSAFVCDITEEAYWNEELKFKTYREAVRALKNMASVKKSLNPKDICVCGDYPVSFRGYLK